jgi:hypothetical protein
MTNLLRGIFWSFVVVVLGFAYRACAQDTIKVSSIPRPYLAGSFNLMPGGYASVAWGGGGGLMVENKYFIFDSFVGYDNGHKVNDNTLNNYKGHDRFVRGFESYKKGNNYFGVGARWSQLSTTNYTKGGSIYTAGAWHPEVGVGRDFFANDKFYPLMMRAQMLYMFHSNKETVHYPDGTNCDGCGNGSQGVDLSLWWPSPAKKSHIFFRMNVVMFGFHDSITDPANLQLTQLQRARTHVSDSTELMLMYRF